MPRVDQLLVQRGLAPTRSAAQRLIAQGAVRWRAQAGWAVPGKAGDELPPTCELELTNDAELRWASRAGLKLEAALDAAQLQVAGHLCLDLGQSTGGFTDVLLARGAAHVVGVDVGHGQLLARLRNDPRVTVHEGLNARSLDRRQLGLPDASTSATAPGGGFGLVVGDLSFISLTLVLPALVPLLAPAADVLLLVKPQFELQPGQIGKGGLVKDPAHYDTVKQRLQQACVATRLGPPTWTDSPIAGGDGNREFFLHARPLPPAPDKDTP